MLDLWVNAPEVVAPTELVLLGDGPPPVDDPMFAMTADVVARLAREADAQESPRAISFLGPIERQGFAESA